MTDQEFNKQYDAAQPRTDFAKEVQKFVTDPESALAALQVIDERLQRLDAPPHSAMRLHFLAEDLRDLLEEAQGYYKSPTESEYGY